MVRWKTAAAALVTLLLATTHGARASEEYWYAAVKEVDAQAAGRDLTTWSDELSAGLESADLKRLVTAVCVFVRCGQEDRIAAAAAQLRKHQPAQPDIVGMSDAVIEAGLWAAARSLMDQFPDVRCGRVEAFIKHWEDRGDVDGAQAWLRTRYEATEPLWYAKDLMPWELWADPYYAFLQRHERLAPLVETLRGRITGRHDDFTAARQYLLAVRHVMPEAKRPNICWLGDAFRPTRPMDAWELGRALASAGCHAAAVKQLEQALALPVTEYDRQRIGTFSNMAFFNLDMVRRVLLRWTRESLIRSCLAVHANDRAQVLAEELAMPDGGALTNEETARLAGEVEGATGKRVIEQHILKAEGDHRGEVRYWLCRGDYFDGRAEANRAAEAYGKAVFLPFDESAAPWHAAAVRTFGAFLERLGRNEEAAKLYRSELDRTDPSSALAVWLAGKLRRMQNKN